MVEGSEATITSDNIKVLADLEKLGISSAAVLFHMIEFPKHGELSFGANTKQRKVFSLTQLRSNKVVYLHNGKENLGDSFVFEIEIDSSDTAGSNQAALGSLMTVRQRHLFEIRILPVNDKPVVRGTLGSILMMAAGTKMTLPPQFLQVETRDNEYHFLQSSHPPCLSLAHNIVYHFTNILGEKKSSTKFLFQSEEVISSLY